MAFKPQMFSRKSGLPSDEVMNTVVGSLKDLGDKKPVPIGFSGGYTCEHSCSCSNTNAHSCSCGNTVSYSCHKTDGDEFLTDEESSSKLKL